LARSVIADGNPTAALVAACYEIGGIALQRFVAAKMDAGSLAWYDH